MIAETFTELIKDPNHWAFELVTSVVEFVIVGVIATPIVRWFIRNHDRTHHPKDIDIVKMLEEEEALEAKINGEKG